MRAIFGAIEMNHAIDTRERCATTLVTVGIELLLGENITAVLLKY